MFETKVSPTLNPTVNLTDSFNKSKCQIKTYLMNESCHSSLLLKVLEIFFPLVKYQSGTKIPTRTVESTMLYQVSYQASLLHQKVIHMNQVM